MPVFVVSTPAKMNQRMRAAVRARYKEDHIEPWPGTWFIKSDSETTKEVALSLLGEEGERITCVVCPVTGYWGYADPELWEWLALRRQK